MTDPRPAILHAAVDMIDRRGWRQGRPVFEKSGVCAVDAIVAGSYEVGLSGDDRYEAMQRTVFDVSHHITPARRRHGWRPGRYWAAVSTVTHWNDELGRTEDEVRDALLHTAKEISNATA